MSSRRDFLKKSMAGALAGSVLPAMASSAHTHVLNRPKLYAPNDQVNIAIIGMGIMGFANAEVSASIPGVRLVGVSDLYKGRLERAKEKFGKELFTTADYRELINRKDIDAIIVATSDHWHDHISIAAMNAGKHVYCEKPMVHRLEEGDAVIQTQKKTGKVFQVGSQRVSSIATLKAKEIFESGVIGELVLVESFMDRHSPNGAWQYSIPTDARANTVDWDRFLGDAPKIPYDPVRFFRWRNYVDYGTGMAGDLFVHLFSALHTIISSKGPERIFATGGLRYFKDGRDVPDVFCGLYDYPASDKHPAFTLQMRVNFVDGSDAGERLQLIGTDGAIIVGWNEVKVIRNKMAKNAGYGGWDSFDTFSAAQQKEYEKWYKSQFPEKNSMRESDQVFTVPEDYSANIDHHDVFYRGIREKGHIVEDAMFGMQAAGPALASNESYFQKKVIFWDPGQAKMRT